MSTSPGKGPPYTLMQKGVDEPALAWCLAEGPEEDDWGDECGRDSKATLFLMLSTENGLVWSVVDLLP